MDVEEEDEVDDGGIWSFLRRRERRVMKRERKVKARPP